MNDIYYTAPTDKPSEKVKFSLNNFTTTKNTSYNNLTHISLIGTDRGASVALLLGGAGIHEENPPV